MSRSHRRALQAAHCKRVRGSACLGAERSLSNCERVPWAAGLTRKVARSRGEFPPTLLNGPGPARIRVTTVSSSGGKEAE